jgi:uncharacterized repeat protein (TIGR01451 family)
MRPSRLSTIGLVLGALLLLAGPALAVTPTLLIGNQTCSNVVPGATELKVEPVVDGTFTSGGFSVTLDVRATSLGQVFDWTATGGVVLGVVVKGGPNANFYDYRPGGATSDTSLHAPVNPKTGKYYGLSHVSFCFTPGAPALTISKSGTVDDRNSGRAGLPDPGDSITYTVTFSNTGTAAATKVVVTDDINEGLANCDQTVTFTSATLSGVSGSVTQSSGVVTATVASLGPGQGGTLTIVVGVPAGTFHDCNRASIESDQTSLQYSNTVTF